MGEYYKIKRHNSSAITLSKQYYLESKKQDILFYSILLSLFHNTRVDWLQVLAEE